MSALLQNHFELFGLEPSYDLDREALAAVHLDLQKAVHPDRFAGSSPQEKRLAVQRAAQVNEAYRTLRSPVDRARYLLKLRGIDTEEESNTAMDPAFLMEQMEWRERLDEFRGADDAAGLLAFAGELEQARRAMHRELGDCFQRGDRPALDQASGIVRKLRFLERLEQQVAEIEERH